MSITMKSALLAGAVALALAVPATTQAATDLAAHQPATTAAPALPLPATQTPAATPVGTAMNCPMNGGGQASMMSNQPSTASPAQQRIGGGGNPVQMPSAANSAPAQGGMMANGHMASCPMMTAPAVATPPADTNATRHADHHPNGQ